MVVVTMMEATHSSKLLVDVQWTTWHYNLTIQNCQSHMTLTNVIYVQLI
jgi:hypothetical protein